MRKKFTITYDAVISVENLLEAWKEFIRGKRKSVDIQQFSQNLMDNILSLHRELANKSYSHGGYQAFNISDPKPRNIHKASVRDRLLHHALYRQMYPFFSRTFIADSFSCQRQKGTHRALDRFRAFAFKVSRNHTRTCWILKCDIRKFFANVDQEILERILSLYVVDERIFALLKNIVRSFHAQQHGVGLPLGNLTSQLLVNIYMNEFDQFVKHRMKEKYYLRYCDDFALLSEDRGKLVEKIPMIRAFLSERLKLELHPKKIFIKTIASGADFLGWVHFSDRRIPRTTTKRRMLNRIKVHSTEATLNSYLGLLKHGRTEKLKQELVKEFYLNQEKSSIL